MLHEAGGGRGVLSCSIVCIINIHVTCHKKLLHLTTNNTISFLYPDFNCLMNFDD